MTLEKDRTLLVSFSGGETSAFMAAWLMKNKSKEYDLKFVFANTGQENEQTLEFVRRCDSYFSLGVVWLETEPYYNERKSSGFRIVTFETASRDGEPFDRIIKKYGIPNPATPHCTRELKLSPIKAWAAKNLRADYETAIGIRVDEIDRMSKDALKNRLVYPLISWRPTTKEEINAFWRDMPFRLELKGYQGNCVTCWKKSDRKLYAIAKEKPAAFACFDRLEKIYGSFVPESRIKLMASRGESPPARTT